MSHQSYRDKSRLDWGKDESQGALTLEQINCGAILRIADATEKMAQRHTQLIEERDRYYRYWQDSEKRAGHWLNVIRSLRGQITKLKKKAITA